MAVLLLSNSAQNMVGFVKATADDGHAQHVHLVLFSLTDDITPTGVLLATECFWCDFLRCLNFGAVLGELAFSVLVHTQGG